MSKYKIYTHSERPELIQQLSCEPWPEFINHSSVAIEHYPYMYEHYSDFQFYLCNDDDKVVGDGLCIPIYWDATESGLPGGWDAALATGISTHKAQEKPNTLCALAATVAPGHTGKGVSGHIIDAMQIIAKKHDLNCLIAPVRPSLKSSYPLTPFERYIQWKREDGLLFDPWMRVHERRNAKIMKIAPESMRVTGTIKEWQLWTGLTFPESGSYVVTGALSPVVIDCEKDTGIYIEPNIWMRHEI
jgi:hypothetical protein